LPPRPPEGTLHRLPPILRTQRRNPAASYSKGARGLFVLSRVIGILTDTPISPSSWRRQRPSRYAIRAGRNLPDKEFRYLRTVIVTAAVYRGFGSKLHRPEGPLTSPLNLPAPGRRQCLYGVSSTSQAPVFLLNSRLGRFSAARFSSPPHGWVTYHGHPFSRSYGVILPSSFSMNHSSTLGFSPRLPVSVCGTVGPCTPVRGFSRRPASRTLCGVRRPLRHRLSRLTRRICLPGHATTLHRDNQRPTALLLPCPPLQSNAHDPAREC
jgi:hypothetical protein